MSARQTAAAFSHLAEHLQKLRRSDATELGAALLSSLQRTNPPSLRDTVLCFHSASRIRVVSSDLFRTLLENALKDEDLSEDDLIKLVFCLRHQGVLRSGARTVHSWVESRLRRRIDSDKPLKLNEEALTSVVSSAAHLTLNVTADLATKCAEGLMQEQRFFFRRQISEVQTALDGAGLTEHPIMKAMISNEVQTASEFAPYKGIKTNLQLRSLRYAVSDVGEEIKKFVICLQKRSVCVDEMVVILKRLVEPSVLKGLRTTDVTYLTHGLVFLWQSKVVLEWGEVLTTLAEFFEISDKHTKPATLLATAAALFKETPPAGSVAAITVLAEGVVRQPILNKHDICCALWGLATSRCSAEVASAVIGRADERLVQGFSAREASLVLLSAASLQAVSPLLDVFAECVVEAEKVGSVGLVELPPLLHAMAVLAVSQDSLRALMVHSAGRGVAELVPPRAVALLLHVVIVSGVHSTKYVDRLCRRLMMDARVARLVTVRALVKVLLDLHYHNSMFFTWAQSVLSEELNGETPIVRKSNK